MRWTILFLLMAVTLAAGTRFVDRLHPGTLRVTFFDVGQGDSILLRFPRGKAWLVDAGGGYRDWDRGKKELPLELTRMGILTLDVAFLSHPDQDHGLGFRGLWPQLKIREFLWNGAFEFKAHPLLEVLLALGEKHGTALRPVSAPEAQMVDGVSLSVFPVAAGDSTNEKPLVLLAAFGGCRVLLAGDAEKKAERAIAKKIRSVEILKLSHHGSRSSSADAFLDALRPRWAVASVGLGNIYRHPSQEVLARMRRKKIALLRTDFHGYVEFTVTSQGGVSCMSSQGDCGSSSCR